MRLRSSDVGLPRLRGAEHSGARYADDRIGRMAPVSYGQILFRLSVLIFFIVAGWWYSDGLSNPIDINHVILVNRSGRGTSGSVSLVFKGREASWNNNPWDLDY